MSGLKEENIKKCVTLLREFINGPRQENRDKKVALLALDQLQKITAGQNKDVMAPQCYSKPRADM
jgi:hypothetical protein